VLVPVQATQVVGSGKVHGSLVPTIGGLVFGLATAHSCPTFFHIVAAALAAAAAALACILILLFLFSIEV
jgi:hypothetical protein